MLRARSLPQPWLEWVGRAARQAISVPRLAARPPLECVLALAGALLAGGAIALLASHEWLLDWPRPARLALAGLIVLAVLAGSLGVWWADLSLAVRRGGIPVQAARWASIPYLPFLALVPVSVQAMRSPEIAHLLLNATSTRTALVGYLAAWFVATEAMVVVWWLCASPARLGPRTPVADDGTVDERWQHPRASISPPVATSHTRHLAPTWAAVLLVLALAVYANSGVLQHPRSWLSEFTQPVFAARQLLEGASPYDSREPIWQHAVNLPPVSLVTVYAPLSFIPDVVLRPLFYALNLAAAGAALWWLLGALVLPAAAPRVRLAVLVAVLGIFGPWRESAVMGQPNGVILFLLVVTLRCLLARRADAGGLALLGALLIKPVSVWLIVFMAAARQYRLLAVFAAGATLALAVSVAVAGMDVWQYYLAERLPDLLRGTARYGNASLPALHARLFVTSHALYLTDPLPALPLAAALDQTAILLGLLLLVRLVRSESAPAPDQGVLQFGLAVALALALTNLAWLHYTTWLLVSLAALAQPGVWESLVDRRRWIVASLAGAGFVSLALDSGQYLRAVGELLPAWPLLGSLHNLGLLGVVAALALALAAYRASPAAPSRVQAAA